jgi:cell division protein FtsW (lipid II flippase)
MNIISSFHALLISIQPKEVSFCDLVNQAFLSLALGLLCTHSIPLIFRIALLVVGLFAIAWYSMHLFQATRISIYMMKNNDPRCRRLNLRKENNMRKNMKEGQANQSSCLKEFRGFGLVGKMGLTL